MNKYTELIDLYLSGGMSAAEQRQLEALLETNAELRAEFDLQKQLMKGIARAGISNSIKKGFRKGAFKAKAAKVLTAVIITGLTIAIVLAVKNNVFSKKNESLRYELNEENKKAWSDADTYLTPELFTINGNRDTVIETKGGIIYTIPAQAFVNAAGNVVSDNIEIEVKEALTPLEIMKAGLSTTSDGRLLETGGMFYLNARQHGNNLSIAKNKGIYTSIPSLNPGHNMQLFEGRRTEGGRINWVNPKPFESKLQPVDILSLDFYPPHFLDSLKAFGVDVANKKRTDSIYYSFVCGTRPDIQLDERYPTRYAQADSVRKDSAAHASEGSVLFRQNCAVCHSAGTKKLTGPGLAGIMQRVPQPALPWLTSYILNCEKVLKSGDAYANKVYEENGKAAMTVFEGQLSEKDVAAILQFINSGLPESVSNAGRSECELDPSRIHAIWDKRFNNTLIATKEFEERLQAIFKTCNHSILDLYITNMDKKMYQVDSMASALLNEGPGSGMIFKNFYYRKDGGVSISESHLKKLQDYMTEKQNVYKEAAAKTWKKLYEKERVLDKAAFEKMMEQGQKEGTRISTTFNQELELNMDEAYRQLGKPRPKVAPAGGYLSTTLVSTGWKNVDAFVFEATVNRTTLDYTDPETGKKAVIKYEPFSITVTDHSSYERVNAYLIPDQLSSFQRIQNTGNVFKESLNELIRYSAVVIGFKGEDLYWSKIGTATPGAHTVTLRKMSQKDLAQYKSMNPGAVKDVVADVKYAVFEQKERMRNRAVAKREELRARLWPVVFPCASPLQQVPAPAKYLN